MALGAFTPGNSLLHMLLYMYVMIRRATTLPKTGHTKGPISTHLVG